jgi:putative heme iron utilization protein
MTDIDRTADIDVSRGFAQVTVRIPLSGHVNQEWVSHFTHLAQKWMAHSGNEKAFLRAGEGVIEAQDLPDDRILQLPFSGL